MFRCSDAPRANIQRRPTTVAPLATHQLEQHRGRFSADLTARRMHGRQRRDHLVASGEVVETGDCHLSWNLDVLARRGQQGALRQVVVAEKDRVDRRRLADDLLEHLPAERKRRRSRVQPFELRIVSSGPCEFEAPALQALHRPWIPRRPTNTGPYTRKPYRTRTHPA
jgi:hypothetical protein